MQTSDISYEADGTTFVGRIAVPDGDARLPGVLLAHEGNGLDDWNKEKAQRFAALGYVAFALDYHGGGQPLADRDAMMARLGALRSDPGRLRVIARAGLEVLLSQPRVDPSRVAVAGYCFGGTVALELARSGADLKAVVGFHPGLGPARPEDAHNITGSVLMLLGADDPLISEEQRAAFQEEMRSAGVDWRLVLYGGAQHGFTNPNASHSTFPGNAYDERADARSWRAMRDLFDEVL